MSNKGSTQSADGLLVIDKPSRITSMDVVRRIKRAGQLKKVGHGGTLDPIATGVIPICLGQATRMMEYLVEGGKEYRGVVELGVKTDTYDSAGKVISTSDTKAVKPADIERALSEFTGKVSQIPPMYSALKRDGQRLYDLARAGIEVQREPRLVSVEKIILEEYEPPLATVFVSCGRGFYMRSLAHDLGEALGVGGNLKNLIRLRVGPFSLRDALSLETAESLLARGGWEEHLQAPDAVLSDLPAIVLGDGLTQMLRQGRPLPVGARIPPGRTDDLVRAYSTHGEFVALLLFDASDGQWHPQKVFNFNYLKSDSAYNRESV